MTIKEFKEKLSEFDENLKLPCLETFLYNIKKEIILELKTKIEGLALKCFQTDAPCSHCYFFKTNTMKCSHPNKDEKECLMNLGGRMGGIAMNM